MPALPETEGQVSISGICPYPAGSRFVERARSCFHAQTYRPTIFVEIENIPHSHSVGWLRNECIVGINSKFIAHFDHDDWSAPDRLAIQLAHIQETGKLVTGFYSVTLYDQINDETWVYCHEDKRYSIGAGLFYKREAWERVKFPDQTPEDPKWLRLIGEENRLSRPGFREDGSPIMIQVIHGSNASARIFRNSPRYTKAPAELHAQVKEILAHA